MKREDAEEFTQGIGQVIGGSYKIIASAQRMGVPKALGLTTEQWVNQRLGGYVKMTIEDRREVVAELAAEDLSTRDIAGVVGVDHSTVVRDLGANAPDEQPDEPTGAAEQSDAGANATPPKAHVSNNSGEREWYTPVEIADLARKVAGGFDLDPASTAEANGGIKAFTYFSEQDDGLTKDWSGRIWLNPPYENGLVSSFTKKLGKELADGGGPVGFSPSRATGCCTTSWMTGFFTRCRSMTYGRGHLHKLNLGGACPRSRNESNPRRSSSTTHGDGR